MDGDDLLSHRVTAAVPLALGGLTSVFGMGTGRALPLTSPSEGVAHRNGVDAELAKNQRSVSWKVKPIGRLVQVS